MKIKRNGLLCVVAMFAMLFVAVLLIVNTHMPKIDTVNINDFAKTIQEGASDDVIESMKKEYNLDYYYVDDELVIYNNAQSAFSSAQIYALTIIIFTIIVAIAFLLFYIFYVNTYVIRPFNKLREFAGSVARGNLDAPLLMDKQNVFGAFTESFDIMREELAKAKENERIANESKKELVLSLIHIYEPTRPY